MRLLREGEVLRVFLHRRSPDQLSDDKIKLEVFKEVSGSVGKNNIYQRGNIKGKDGGFSPSFSLPLFFPLPLRNDGLSGVRYC